LVKGIPHSTSHLQHICEEHRDIFVSTNSMLIVITAFLLSDIEKRRKI